MAARIRSLRNGIDPVDEASREDLGAGDVVVVSSLDAATTYNWTLAFVPEGSTATFSGSSTAVSPGSFTVDLPGSYLVRLIVDISLPTESTQYVRLRALTTLLGLKLVAAGERRDSTGIIPVDVDAEGWANEQNYNLLALEAATAGGETLNETLVLGNETGGEDIVLSSGDEIVGEGGVALAADATLRGGTATGGVAAGGNVVLRSGEGFGGGADGSVEVQTAAGVTAIQLAATQNEILFEQGASPTTGANQGALFVADGSGGTTADHPYYRHESNGALVDLLAGGGSGVYFEYYVDPNQAADPTAKLYQTIAAALAAATVAGETDPVVRLAETTHVWDGSDLDLEATSTTIYSEGRATIAWEVGSSLTAEGRLMFKGVRHDCNSLGVFSFGTFTVNSAPLTAGDYVEIDGLQYVGVAGARTPGNNDWDASLGTVNLIAAEILACITDPNNWGDFGGSWTASVLNNVVTVTSLYPVASATTSISASTTPGGGVTASGAALSGGTDVFVLSGIVELILESNYGLLRIETNDVLVDAVPAFKNWYVYHSDLILEVLLGDGDTSGEGEGTNNRLYGYFSRINNYFLDAYPFWDDGTSTANWEVDWYGSEIVFNTSFEVFV